jgi:hypothetical protein
MIPELDAFSLPGADTTHHAATGSAGAENTGAAAARPAVTPKRRGGRSLPPT